MDTVALAYNRQPGSSQQKWIHFEYNDQEEEAEEVFGEQWQFDKLF